MDQSTSPTPKALHISFKIFSLGIFLFFSYCAILTSADEKEKPHITPNSFCVYLRSIRIFLIFCPREPGDTQFSFFAFYDLLYPIHLIHPLESILEIWFSIKFFFSASLEKELFFYLYFPQSFFRFYPVYPVYLLIHPLNFLVQSLLKVLYCCINKQTFLWIFLFICDLNKFQ